MRTLSLFTLIILIAQSSFSQIKATTEDGRQVLLNRDGTWNYSGQNSKNVSFECNSLTTQKENVSASSEVLLTKGSGGQSIGIFLRKDEDDVYYMLLNVKGAGNCMRKESAINISYRDGSSSKIKNNSDNNCDNRQKVILGKATKTNELINALKNKEVASIVVYSQDGKVTSTLDNQQGKVLLNTLWCLTSR